MSNSQSNIPGIKPPSTSTGGVGSGNTSNPGSNSSATNNNPPKKKKENAEKEESDHEKSDGELVVDDNTEVSWLWLLRVSWTLLANISQKFILRYFVC